jgi:Rrf2 family transcriptional regulator, cysteine metabolism repressor
MMVELAKGLQKEKLVHLGHIAQLTGLSENYLAQLAMALKNEGLILGVSGKKGGYQLARPPQEIRVAEIVKAAIGPICVTDCVNSPAVCLNSDFCETRMIWALVNYRIQETLEKYTLADLADRSWMDRVRAEYPDIALLFPARLDSEQVEPYRGCPIQKD